MPEYTKISFEANGNVGIITINNTPVNVLGKKVVEEMLQCLHVIKNDNACRVVVITGAGDKAFMAGADIRELPQLIAGEPGFAKEFSEQAHSLFDEIDFFPKPTIAVINGMALGGGCELALACDIRIASEDAVLGLPEIKLGIFPGGGGTQRLPRLIGSSRAFEMLYFGDHISASQALEFGLLNRIVPKSELYDEALKIAVKLSKMPGRAVSLIKEAVDRGLEVSLKEALKVEIDLFEDALLTKDAKEGISAFIEKRKPNFSHE